MNFSLEIGPNTDLETVPPVSDVYITMLPGGDYKDTAQKATRVTFEGGRLASFSISTFRSRFICSAQNTRSKTE